MYHSTAQAFDSHPTNASFDSAAITHWNDNLCVGMCETEVPNQSARMFRSFVQLIWTNH